MKRRAHAFFTLSLVATDLVTIALGFYLAYRLYEFRTRGTPLEPPPFSNYAGMFVIQVVTLLSTFFFAKLYHRKRSQFGIDEVTTLFSTISVGTFMAIAFTSLIFNRLEYSRWIVVYAWLLSVALVTWGRFLHATLQSYLRAHAIGADRVLIVGANEIGWTMAERIRRAPSLGYQLVGFVDDVAGQLPPAQGVERETVGDFRAPSVPLAELSRTTGHNGDETQESTLKVKILGPVRQLEEIIDRYGIDEVIIALPERSHTELLDIISRCHREKVSIKVFPDVFQIMASEVSIGHLDGLPLLTVRDVALRGWKLTLKRIVDILFSALALIVLSPLMLLIALLIKLDSPGPVFYCQERMGLDARPFQVIKFRTMHVDAEAQTGPVWARPDDPRRTRLGTFLRRFSLDELPQFINVLLGEMSIVGPRPERPVFVEEFRRSIPRYMDRHREKAGLTGWAQVNGLRGDTSIWERTKYDLWYIENWSLLLDFKIMLKTFVKLLTDRNAY